jgi:hypothetical protein
MKRLFLTALQAALAAAFLCLSGCGVKYDPSPQPNTTATMDVPGTPKPKTVAVTITEVCHGGYVYLVTSSGGITPKVFWQHTHERLELIECPAQ